MAERRLPTSPTRPADGRAPKETGRDMSVHPYKHTPLKHKGGGPKEMPIQKFSYLKK